MTRTITPEYLKDVQRAGWILDHVVDGMAVGQCPRAGCGLRVNLRPGAMIPQACPTVDTMADVPVRSFAAMVAFLAERRAALALNQPDAESCIGVAGGHLAKIEAGARQPSPATLFDWAAGLGYQVVLKPAGLPPKALAVISQTREKAALKRRRYQEKRKSRREDV